MNVYCIRMEQIYIGEKGKKKLGAILMISTFQERRNYNNQR